MYTRTHLGAGFSCVCAVLCFFPEATLLGISCLSSLCSCPLTVNVCPLCCVKWVPSDSGARGWEPAAASSSAPPVVLQLFSEVQERAIEEQMAAVKDVVMEPTVKTLSDDLVCSH